MLQLAFEPSNDVVIAGSSIVARGKKDLGEGEEGSPPRCFFIGGLLQAR